jgi:hypothetical protein
MKKAMDLGFGDRVPRRDRGKDEDGGSVMDLGGNGRVEGRRPLERHAGEREGEEMDGVDGGETGRKGREHVKERDTQRGGKVKTGMAGAAAAGLDSEDATAGAWAVR